MEFLLNHTRLFIFSFVTLFAQSFFMLVSFYFSKKFMDMEMDKLKKESTHFDLGLILAFGMIISTIISFVGTLIVNATAKYFFTDPEYLYSSYFELLIVFSAILLASCVLFARPKEHLRFKNISHTDSKNVHKKFMRMVLVSLFITTVAYSVVNTLLGTQYSLICEYCAIGVIIIYCFGEICLSHDLISKVLNLKKTKTITVSEKIAVGQDLVVKMASCDINIRYAFFVCDIDAICLAVILADIGVELFQKTRASWWDFTASH